MTDVKWECGICGREHQELPLDIAYLKPMHYFLVPEDERERRVFINEDLCVIDDREFLVRGFLPLPIRETDNVFGWGIWAIVDRRDFERYVALYEADAYDEPPFHGHISASMPPYPDTYLLPVSVQLRGANERPVLNVLATDHPLYFEQRDGINMERAHEMVRISMPWLFDK